MGYVGVKTRVGGPICETCRFKVGSTCIGVSRGLRWHINYILVPGERMQCGWYKECPPDRFWLGCLIIAGAIIGLLWMSA